MLRTTDLETEQSLDFVEFGMQEFTSLIEPHERSLLLYKTQSLQSRLSPGRHRRGYFLTVFLGQ